MLGMVLRTRSKTKYKTRNSLQLFDKYLTLFRTHYTAGGKKGFQARENTENTGLSRPKASVVADVSHRGVKNCRQPGLRTVGVRW